jgi:hypothetical protein
VGNALSRISRIRFSIAVIAALSEAGGESDAGSSVEVEADSASSKIMLVRCGGFFSFPQSLFMAPGISDGMG